MFASHILEVAHALCAAGDWRIGAQEGRCVARDPGDEGDLRRGRVSGLCVDKASPSYF